MSIPVSLPPIHIHDDPFEFANHLLKSKSPYQAFIAAGLSGNINAMEIIYEKIEKNSKNHQIYNVCRVGIDKAYKLIPSLETEENAQKALILAAKFNNYRVVEEIVFHSTLIKVNDRFLTYRDDWKLALIYAFVAAAENGSPESMAKILNLSGHLINLQGQVVIETEDSLINEMNKAIISKGDERKSAISSLKKTAYSNINIDAFYSSSTSTSSSCYPSYSSLSKHPFSMFISDNSVNIVDHFVKTDLFQLMDVDPVIQFSPSREVIKKFQQLRKRKTHENKTETNQFKKLALRKRK